MTAWNETVDVCVMGSGAAGLTGALRAAHLGQTALIVEKSPVWGGSAAMSAGALWVPNNPHMRRAGIADSDDAGLRYLKGVTFGEIGEDRLRAFIQAANRMLVWLESETQVSFTCLEYYPDYNGDVDGAVPGGRSLEPMPFDGSELGDEFRTLHAPYAGTLVLGKFLMRIPEARELLLPGLRPKLGLLTGLGRYVSRYPKRRRFDRDPYLTMGQALTSRLRRSLLDRRVPMWLSAPVHSLVVEDGRVVGVEVERDGRRIAVRARRGVLVASGGFERNAEMRRRYQRAPIGSDWTAGHVDNVGDGIRLGEAVGARLATDMMREAWWTPAVVPPSGQASVLVIEKSLPHGLFVSGDGRRFVNEATSYNDVGIAQYECDKEFGGTVPAWMIVDATYRKRYILGPIGPGQMVPDKRLPPALRPDAGWLHRADSIVELARGIGIEPGALEATVRRFNEAARVGKDSDFRRGETANDRYYSDPRVTPNPSLGPVETPPFYAVAVYPGDLGTKAGLCTDEAFRVLGENGPIPGLYAAGNVASPVMGRSYPGAGATLAPAMVGGMLAAESMADTCTDGGSQTPSSAPA